MLCAYHPTPVYRLSTRGHDSRSLHADSVDLSTWTALGQHCSRCLAPAPALRFTFLLLHSLCNNPTVLKARAACQVP